MSMPMFSGRSAARAGNFEHFLKTFREKRTEVTFGFSGDPLEHPEIFNFREHFDYRTTMPGARKPGVSYPCVMAEENNENCIGCDYPVDHPEWTDAFLKTDEGKALFGTDFQSARGNRRKEDPGWGIRVASPRYVVPIIDADGNINLFKIGFKFAEYLRDAQKVPEIGELDQQRFVVVKMGEGLTTTYSLLPTNQPVWTSDRDRPTFADVSNILGKSYFEAFTVYRELGLVGEDGAPTGAAPPDEAQTQTEPTVPTPATDAAKARAEKQQMPKGLEGLDIPEGWDPFLNAREASVGEMKDWLDNDPRGKHEYPARPSRPVLQALIEKAQVPF